MFEAAKSQMEKVDSPQGSMASLASTKGTATAYTLSTQASPTTNYERSLQYLTLEPTYNLTQGLADHLFASRPSSLTSLSSLEHPACRICQSETGDMVRPCGCAGTMGDIHETCLSKWVTTSQHKERCEICHENYAHSEAVFKNIRKWSRPKLELANIVAFGTLFGLIFAVLYLVSLMSERLFIDRVFVNNLPIRSDDYARLLLTILMASLAGGMVAFLISQCLSYIGQQKEIRFVNKYKIDGTTESR